MENKRQPRSFRGGVLMVLGTVMAVFVVVFFAVLQTSMSGMLRENETRSLRNELDMAASLVYSLNQNLVEKATDLAYWTETVAFAAQRDDAYLTRNEALLDPEWDYDNNLTIIKDAQGRDLYSAYYDMAQGGLPRGLDGTLRSMATDVMGTARLQLADGGTEGSLGRSGLLFLDGKVFYVSMMPICLPGSDATVYGTVTAGRELDEAFFAQIALQGESRFVLHTDDSGLAAGTFLIDEKTADTITASIILSDIQGRSARVTATMPRTAYLQGEHTLLITTLILVAVAGFFIILMYLGTTRTVIQPIEKLSADISDSAVGILDPHAYSESREFVALCEAINDQVQHLNDSRMSLQVFDHILNGMNAFLYVSDPYTGTVIFINDRMMEHFGIGKDCIGKPCWTLLKDEQTDRCAYCPLPELMENPDRPVTWEEMNDRTGRHYRNTDSLIDWIDGRKMHLHHRIDITEQKQAEQAVQRRMRQQEIMAEMTSKFITEHDVDAFVNSALEMAGEFIGAGRVILARYDPQFKANELAYEWWDEGQGMTPMRGDFRSMTREHPIFQALMVRHEPYVALDDVQAMEHMDTMKSRGVTSLLSMPVLVKGEVWGFITVTIFTGPHRWSTSDIHLFTMIVSIITAVIERRLSEDGLVRMSSIAEGSPSYISYVNQEGKFEYFNAGATELTGYSPEELREHGMSLLFDEETLQRLQYELIPKIREQGHYRFELPYIHKSGEHRLLAFSAFTISSHPTDLGSIADDITEQRRMEQELVVAKEEAERSSHAKGDFLSRMSHEMRTPMNAIIGMTNMAMGVHDIEKKDYCLGKIDEASTHLLGVINDILDMSKIEANKFELSIAEFEFERMLQRVVDIVTFRLDEKNQNLLVDIDPDIAPSVISDEQRLSQILTNLLSNATKFTDEAGTIGLAVRQLADEDGLLTLQFRVTDNGIGISAEQQARLFTAFEQADGGISRRFGGTGLGLAISKRIVEMMGGEIHVESALGEGSSFIFTIKTQRGSKQYAKRATGVDMSKLYVLAVDDAPEVREYFANLSERFGFRCDVAADGVQACQMVADAPRNYDIAFVDWKMPVMDGIELTRRLKANPEAPTAVIMISAAEWNDVEDQAIAAGVDRFIPKPLFASVVVDCINSCLGVEAYGAEDETRETAQELHLQGRTILLAEDIEINREIVMSLLEDSGLTIDCAENGTEAVRMFEQNPDRYDLIFMDIHMPEMDGYEATRRIRAMQATRAKTVPIVAMTANVFREDIEKCLCAGMNDHIGKPIDVGEFYHKLKKNMPREDA